MENSRLFLKSDYLAIKSLKNGGPRTAPLNQNALEWLQNVPICSRIVLVDFKKFQCVPEFKFLNLKVEKFGINCPLTISENLVTKFEWSASLEYL